MMLEKMQGHRKALAAFACAAVLGAGLLAGCSSGASNEPAPEASSAPVAAAETSADTSAAVAPAKTAVAIEAGDATAPASFALANMLGAKVTSIELAAVAEGAEFEAYPFTVGDSLAPEQEATVHFVGDADAYDMRLTTMDGTEYTVHNLPLASVESPVMVQVADGIAYAVYDADGAHVDTLEAEAELASAPAEEEATEEYTEETYEPTYEDSYDYGYEESYDYSYDYGGGAQGEEGCVSDIVLR